MVGRPSSQKLGAAGHVRSTIRKQRKMNPSAQRGFSPVYLFMYLFNLSIYMCIYLFTFETGFHKVALTGLELSV